MYKNVTFTPPQRKSNNVLCNTNCKKIFGWQKNNIRVSKTTNADEHACADWQLLDIFNVIWIMRGKIVVFWSNLNHSFANRCLTLILSEEEMILPNLWTAASPHISGCFFCFVLFLVPLYLTFSLSLISVLYHKECFWVAPLSACQRQSIRDDEEYPSFSEVSRQATGATNSGSLLINSVPSMKNPKSPFQCLSVGVLLKQQ